METVASLIVFFALVASWFVLPAQPRTATAAHGATKSEAMPSAA